MRTKKTKSTLKNITKYDKMRHTMNGYRVCILRSGSIFMKYITETEAGTMRQAEKMAIKLRDTILKALHAKPNESKSILEAYSALSKEAILNIAATEDDSSYM